jgi:prefoldin beta subunit
MNDSHKHQLQLLQHNLQNILSQQQQFQRQFSEIESALKELETASTAYKILGNLMVSTNKETLLTELNEKKETLTIRIKSLATQEETLKKKTEELQKEMIKELESKK